MKKLSSVLLSLVLLALLFSSGCKEDSSTNPPPASSNFLTINVGYKWNYRNITESDTGSMSYEVIKQYSNNIYMVKQSVSSHWYTGVDTMFWLVKSNEYAEVTDSIGSKKGMSITDNMELNKTYMSVIPTSPNQPADTVYYKLESTSESVTVIAGTFTCMKIILTGTPTSGMPVTTFYLCKSVGDIKYSNQFSNVELVSKNF